MGRCIAFSRFFGLGSGWGGELCCLLFHFSVFFSSTTFYGTAGWGSINKEENLQRGAELLVAFYP